MMMGGAALKKEEPKNTGVGIMSGLDELEDLS
jgi:hypothetical protein